MLRAGRLALTAAALICTAAVAGCASSGSSQPAASGSTPASSSSAPAATSSSNTPAVVAPSSSAPGTPACATSALQVKLGSSDGYAGGVYVIIDFTNTSGSTCTLFGYPGVSLVTGPPYKQIGLAAHTLQGAASNFGARPLRSVAIELEELTGRGETAGAGQFLTRIEQLSWELIAQLNAYRERQA